VADLFELDETVLAEQGLIDSQRNFPFLRIKWLRMAQLAFRCLPT
jgi:hypothetical protein